MEEYNIEQDLAIDLNKLHIEWLRHSQTAMKYIRLSSEARKARDKAKENIDFVRAECDNNIRKDLQLFGCPTDKSGLFKPTEAWIAATIQRQPEFQTANDNYHEANYNYNVLSGAVTLFDHRKAALENEVALWKRGYFSTPFEVPDEIIPGNKGVNAEAVAEVVDKQREGLSRRRRGVA